MKWRTAGHPRLPKRATQMAENSFSRILANLASPEKSISDASACKSTANSTEFEVILKFYDHKHRPLRSSVSLSPSSSFKVCSFWMSRFYEWSDKGKGGWRAEREGEVEDRGRGDRDEFTVYYTRLDRVRERFFFFILKCTFQGFISDSNLDNSQNWWERHQFGSQSSRSGPMTAGGEEGLKTICKSLQFVAAIHKNDILFGLQPKVSQ